MAYCWDDEDRDRPHPTPYVYCKNGVHHAACDHCGWHSYGLSCEKRRIAQRWADGHACPMLPKLDDGGEPMLDATTGGRRIDMAVPCSNADCIACRPLRPVEGVTDRE